MYEAKTTSSPHKDGPRPKSEDLSKVVNKGIATNVGNAIEKDNQLKSVLQKLHLKQRLVSKMRSSSVSDVKRTVSTPEQPTAEKLHPKIEIPPPISEYELYADANVPKLLVITLCL